MEIAAAIIAFRLEDTVMLRLPQKNRCTRCYPALFTFLVAFAATGCPRATIDSEVKPNGAWTRTVVFHGPAVDKTNGLAPVPKIEETFVIPGPPYTVTKSNTEDELKVTCKRQVMPGEIIKRDVVTKGKANGKLVEMSVNECSVKETSPGVFTYREVIHWVGPKPNSMFGADMLKDLKAALPPGFATDANVHNLAEEFSKELLSTLMGPPDPLLTSLMSEMMMNQDLALRKLTSRISVGFDKSLQHEFGSKMSSDQRLATVKKLSNSVFQSTSNTFKPDPTKNQDKIKDNFNGVALTFAVKLPFKILETNGSIDTLTNEAYWGLYPEAASMGQDIVLTASRKTDAR